MYISIYIFNLILLFYYRNFIYINYFHLIIFIIVEVNIYNYVTS